MARTLIIEFMDGETRKVANVRTFGLKEGVLSVSRDLTSYTETSEGYPIANIRRYYWET